MTEVPPSKPPLVVIPVYMTEPQDLAQTVAAINSIKETTAPGEVEVLCVDDGSPEESLVSGLEAEIDQLGFDLHVKEENSGFSRTVNVGLRRALQNEQDAVLMNADVELQGPWVRRFSRTTDEQGRWAAVVGALLLFPNGLIQHGGIYFSLVTRSFDHMFKYGPQNLPEALEKQVCPVTGALQFIRHRTLATVGLYDEEFRMGWEDVDYCIRVFLAGEECVYNPNIRAIHHEQMFRGRPNEKLRDWQEKSLMYLMMKYREQSFAGLVPFL